MSTDTPTAGPALDLAWFGAGMAVALVVKLRHYPRMIAHAWRHPDCHH